MGKVERFEGVRAGALPAEVRERLGLSPDALVDVSVTPHEASHVRDAAELDAIIARAHEKARGSGVTAENCTDFLYDEYGLPA